MKQKKVLLVDDVKLFLEMAKSFLSREQISMTVAANGNEALKVMRASRPDLVIMDLHMPELDGAECCRQVKADPVLGSIPIVLVDARGRDAELKLCRDAGCDALLTKPFRRTDLLEVTRRFLAVVDRGTPRVQTRLLIRYGNENQQLHDYALNLSVGGFFLETDTVLANETPIGLEFLVPGSPDPVICKGRVSWVNAADSPTKKDLPPGLGIHFHDLRAEDEMTIREFIRSECRVGGYAESAE